MHQSHDPTKTDLHQIVRSHYRQIFYDKENSGRAFPFHTEREFRKYLTCGIPLYGMARFHCSHCNHDKFVAYSCKGRTLCPSCTGRRMSDTAKHLIEEVIPEVPIRQWVLSMPYTHRFLLATNPEFLRKILAIYHRTISRFYLKQAKISKLQNPKVGAITVIQRFGGALNLNVHFHTLYMDGVYYEDEFGELKFQEIKPSHDDVVRLAKILKKRINRKLLNLEEIDSSENVIEAQSVQNRDEFFKLPVPIGKVQETPFQEFKGYRCHYEDGFSLHAKIKIKAENREGLERLCRYVMRGPIAKERIQYSGDGNVLLKLKTPYDNGTTHLKFSPDQFIKRVISLIPPPRQNLIRYIGVFGARHKNRSAITKLASPLKTKIKVKKKVYRTPWADLLKHVFKVDVSNCDLCGSKLKLVACITSPISCQKILKHLNRDTEEVIVAMPRAPPKQIYFEEYFEFP